MRRLRLLRHRLRSVFLSSRVEDELDRELRLHLDALTREALEAGVDASEAQQAARRAFGSMDLARERCRDTRRVGLIDDLMRDLRYATRWLARSPVFTATALLSLALGLGATTGVYSIADAVLWRMLPVASPQDLVFIKAAGTESVGGAPPYPVFARLREETSAFTGMAAFASDDLYLEVDGETEQVSGQVASGTYFDVLGLSPAAGRLTTMADEQARRPVAVVSHAYAQRRFGGAAQALGRSIGFRDRPFTIVGVTPAAFTGLVPGRHIDVTLPITFENNLLANADTWWFEAVARVAPGTSLEAATAQVDAIFQTFMGGMAPGSPTASLRRTHFNRLILVPAGQGLDQLRRRFQTPLHALVLVSGAVLLITCLNLGTLLLVRGATRERELAVRIASGAGTGRLCRQLLTEALLLFATGALLAVGVAHVAVTFLTGLFAGGRSPILVDARWDWRVGVFAASVTLASGLITGLWPAIRLLRRGHASSSSHGHGTRLAGSAHLSRVARFAVAGQFALSLVLLVAAIMAMRTMANLRAVDLGFRPTQVLTMSITPLHLGTPPQDREARAAFWRDTLRRVRAVPGVQSASLSVLTPLSGRDRGRFVSIAGYEPQSDRDRTIKVNLVADDYFQTFGIDIRAGRTLTASDGTGTPVAVVNQAAVTKFFGGRNPLGETLDFGEYGRFQIVGIVNDHKHRAIRDVAPPMTYLSLWHQADSPERVTLSVASSRPPALLARILADQVRAVHSRTLVSDVLAIDEQIDVTLVGERLLSMLATTLAILAIGLAMVGLYGVLTDAVARRRTEFAVRMALGAPRSHVAWMTYREVLWQVAAGVALGLPAALALTPYGASLMFGVTPHEPWTYVLGMVVLAAVALLAAAVPTRRALRIAPAEAIRE
ncbi:Macrolide export ATP-binding/permease protein MacB [Luteitalea pratensis]|uniref:Macrolide export ATP-binding/permease protein MacB n=1 Tax=Luteitalea pratensis TaxID=1855912 RepID=A0A143PJU6_LUTPR|nr:ADOP family duplicated permease [Luteitalea pratensis]AMY08338.1 Macrolide export ATP-binding/permease protein MacB [Luteitalea pratensis]